MNQQFQLNTGETITLVQLPPELGSYVVTIPKSTWDKIPEIQLIGEAQQRGLFIENAMSKSSMIDYLMNYYRTNNFASGKLSLNSYRFDSEIAWHIIQLVYPNIPFINTPEGYKRVLEQLQAHIKLPQVPQPAPVTETTLPPIQVTVPRLSLEQIYNLKDKYTALVVYQGLSNDPNAGYKLTIEDLKNAIIQLSHKRGFISEEDYELARSKLLRFIMSISEDIIDRLIAAYKIPTNPKDTKVKKALDLYRHGVGYHDLLYAYSNYPDMITGNIGYVAKPGEVIGNGVYDISGKVDKNQHDYVDPTPSNIYTYLSPDQLQRVMESRDIHVRRWFGQHQIIMANILNNYDQVLPEWINNIRNNDINNLNRTQLYVRGALAGINMSKLNTAAMSVEEVRDTIRLSEVIVINKTPALPPNKDYKQYINNTGLDYNTAYNVARQGHILKDSNINFPFSIFGHNKSKSETLGYFAELALYPPNVDAAGYETIRTSNPKIIRKLLIEKYKTDDINFLNDDSLLFISSRGYVLPDPNLVTIKERYNKIKDYPNSLLTKLRRLYKLPQMDDDMLKYKLARQKINPLENIIVGYKLNVSDNPNLTNKDKNDLAVQYGARIGMIIPPTNPHKRHYFWNNITKYRYILTRPKTIGPLDKTLLTAGLLANDEAKSLLRNYTDQEIFGYTGVYIPYSSREDILNKVISVRRSPQFFVPTVRTCANEETITTFDDTIDPNVFIIAYGTMFEYFCYNLEDFEESFREFQIEGLEGVTAYRFRKPNEPEQDFSIEDVRSLIPLLELYPTIQGVPQIIEHIRAGLRRAQEMTNYDRAILADFNRLPANDKPIVREWLHQLFIVGMYMRRWQGPPYPYPLHARDTQGPDPNAKVNEELKILGYYPMLRNADGTWPPFAVTGITERLSQQGQSFVNDLRSIEYRMVDEGVRVPRQETRTIGYYLDRVRKSDMCIRMASSILVGTGSYYIRTFFGEDIPGFDPTMVATIM